MYLKAEGFDTYGTDETNMTLAQWAEVQSGCQLSATYNRHGTYGLNITAGNLSECRIGFGDNLSEVIIGFAFNFHSGIPTGSNDSAMEILDNAGGAVMSVIWGSDGSFLVKRGNKSSGTLIAQTDPSVYGASAFYHFEMRSLVSATVGTCEIRINGVTVLNATGLNNAGTANVEFSQLRLENGSGGAGGAAYAVDDLFILDTTGSYNNDFLGDMAVLEDVPDADGTYTGEWTPSTGSDQYAMIDEIPQDGDTSYDEATAVYDTMSVTFPDIDVSFTGIACVELFHISRKTTAGDGSVQCRADSNGTEVAGDTDALTESYSGYRSVFEEDPDTATVWSVAAANAVEMILERVL